MQADVIIHLSGIPHRVIAETMCRHAVTETQDERAARIKRGMPEPTYGYRAICVEKIKQQVTHT